MAVNINRNWGPDFADLKNAGLFESGKSETAIPHATETVDGIDLFAVEWRHEVREAEAHMPWGYGRSASHPDDHDNDGIPSMYGPSVGGPFQARLPDSDDDGVYDGHEYIFWTQSEWEKGTADSEDWSSDGHQCGL